MGTSTLTKSEVPRGPALSFSKLTLAFFLLSYGLLAAASLWAVPEVRSLAGPFAGPFAARLWGHSCGAIDFGPELSDSWIGLGFAAVPLAMRKRRVLWLPPFWLWWIGWLLLAGISMINTLEYPPRTAQESRTSASEGHFLLPQSGPA